MDKKKSRIRRALKLRKQIKKIGLLNRLTVHRTSRHIYAQVITSDNAKIISIASTLEKNIRSKLTSTGNIQAAQTIGKIIAKRTIEKGIKLVVFDRSGFKYHGRIKALAISAREVGLNF